MPGTRGLLMRLRSEGVWATLKGLSAALSPYTYGIYELHDFREKECFRIPDVRIEQGTDKLKQYRNKQHNLPSEFHRDKAGGDETCFFAVFKGRLAAIVWVYSQQIPSRFIALGPDEYEIGYLFTIREFRKDRVGLALGSAAFQELLRQHCRRLFAVIRQGNLRSQVGCVNFGFEKIATVKRPAIFGPRFIPNENKFESWLEAIKSTVCSRFRRPVESVTASPKTEDGK
jgi:acetyltransferase (GNAT) family protein